MQFCRTPAPLDNGFEEDEGRDASQYPSENQAFNHGYQTPLSDPSFVTNDPIKVADRDVFTSRFFPCFIARIFFAHGPFHGEESAFREKYDTPQDLV